MSRKTVRCFLLPSLPRLSYSGLRRQLSGEQLSARSLSPASIQRDCDTLGGSLCTSSGHSSSTSSRISSETSERPSVSDRNLCSRSKSSCIMMWSATIRGAYMRFDFSFKASRQSFRVVYVKRSSPKRSRNASAAVRDGSRSEQRIASHHVGRDRRGLGCQVHDKNASTPCISPHGERLRYPLSSGTPLRSRFSAGSRSDFQKSWAQTSLESFMPGMQSHANQGVGCMSDFCSSCANSLW